MFKRTALDIAACAVSPQVRFHHIAAPDSAMAPPVAFAPNPRRPRETPV